MIKNFFKVALRNLLKRKAYTLINILGLATGMAVCLLIVLFQFFVCTIFNFVYYLRVKVEVIQFFLSGALDGVLSGLGKKAFIV